MGNFGLRSGKLFLMTDAQTLSITPTEDPISVTLPDGNKTCSIYQCVLDLPNLSENARNGHIILGLASNFPMSVVVLCNTGCKVSLKN